MTTPNNRLTNGDLLIEQLDQTLPQTQCTKCGFPDCHAYATAMVKEGALANRCPPGGQEGVIRLTKILQHASTNLDVTRGPERPRPVAVINPMQCIGCTLCIKACPVDAIVGAPKQLHVVIEDRCTGCDLCVPPCPVDCIDMVVQSPDLTGWNAWSPILALQAKNHYQTRKLRILREEKDLLKRQASKAAAKLKKLTLEKPADPKELDRKKAIIQAAMARAKEKLKTPSN